ncbi:MAG: hypothetical protein JW882_00630 [Deltaproteobacteria bacterium]|nr:hypothetical protein [Deltaproteobacteria bacterium]
MIAKKKKFAVGSIMLLVFFVVLLIMFSKVFGNKNGLEYLDDLYNSISKGSAYYIPKVKTETDKYMGMRIELSVDMGDREQAEQAISIFEKSGASVVASDSIIRVKGDLGKILENCIEDADSMYNNDGNAVSRKYGYNERQVLYNWWLACNEMDKDLKRQKKFDAAKVVDLMKMKAVETSYNYYRIEPQKITDRLGVVTFSLIFYVVYTLWYGFAIMYLLEGWGLRLEEH